MALPLSSDLVISGIAREGHELLAMNTFDDLGRGANLRHEWWVDGVPLTGATGKALLLDASHVGKTISVKASYLDALGRIQTVESLPTPTILATPAGQGVHVTVRLSQAAADSMRIDGDASSGLDRIVDGIVRLQALVEGQYNQSQRYSVSPTQVTGYFSDGSTRTRTYVKDDPSATAGLATVSLWEFVKPGALLLSYGGQLRYTYNEATGMLWFQQGIIDDYTLLNQVEDSRYGRQSVVMRGELGMTGGADPAFQGDITSIHMAASQFLESVTFEGRFQASGDFSDIAAGLARSRIDGSLTGLQQRFRDGSVLSLSGQRDALAPQVADGQLLTTQWLGASLPGDDVVELILPERPGPAWTELNTGEGHDTLILEGGGGQIAVDAGPGDDRVVSGAGSQRMAGGSGMDTLVLPGQRKDYLLHWSDSSQSLSLQSINGDTDQASGFERFEFAGTGFTRDALQQTTVAWVQARAWSGAPMPGLSLGQPDAQTDAQGWMRIEAGADFMRLPGTAAADAAARAQVNLQDAIVVLKSMVGLADLNTYQRVAADVDGQGGIGLGDAIAILKHVVGMPVTAPTWTFVRDPADTQASSSDAMVLRPGEDQTVRLVGVLIGDVDGSWTAG